MMELELYFGARTRSTDGPAILTIVACALGASRRKAQLTPS
jgi:hypothetical protein